VPLDGQLTRLFHRVSHDLHQGGGVGEENQRREKELGDNNRKYIREVASGVKIWYGTLKRGGGAKQCSGGA